MKFVAPALMAATVFVMSFSAQAQSDFYRRVTPPQVEQGGVVGVVVLAGREYLGSDESRVRLLPSIDYQWANGWFAGVTNGVGYNASSRSDMAYGARITADFGRKESRSVALSGLGDIDARPQIGGFFNYSPTGSVSLSSSLRYGSGNDRNGLILDLGAGWSTSLSQSVRLSTSLATTWANTNAMQDYFGVNAAQSASSGYGLYRAGAGLRDVRAGATLIYQVAPAWTLTGSLTHTQLLGDAKRSPIVRQENTTSALVALGLRF